MNLTSDVTSPPVVLIVEDHDDSAAMYAEFLSSHGFVPTTAQNAADAFAIACDVQPDVVVTDVVLPGASGLDLTRRLRHDPRTADIRIVVVTACVFPRDAEAARSAGCDSFLVKPCLPEMLASEIRRVLATGRRTPYQDVLERIRAEYLEMPGMRLKAEQVRRLCGVDAAVCRLVLDALVHTKFLSLAPDGSYARSTDGVVWPVREPHAPHSPSSAQH